MCSLITRAEWDNASALSPFRREHQYAPDTRHTWEAALFGKVSGSCSIKQVKSFDTDIGSRSSTSKSSASRTAKTEKAERQLRRETTGVERGVELAAGIRGGSKPGGASRRDDAGSGGGREKRGRVQAPQQRTRDRGGWRRGDSYWEEEEEEYDEEEDPYDYDDEDLEEDYE